MIAGAVIVVAAGIEVICYDLPFGSAKYPLGVLVLFSGIAQTHLRATFAGIRQREQRCRLGWLSLWLVRGLIEATLFTAGVWGMQYLGNPAGLICLLISLGGVIVWTLIVWGTVNTNISRPRIRSRR